MSRIGAILVRVREDAAEQVILRLGRMPGVEVVETHKHKLAVLIEGDSPKEQEKRHREIAGWPDVMEALMVFQSGEVEA